MRWIEEAYALEEAMIEAGGHGGRIAVTRLTVDEVEIPAQMRWQAKRALEALAHAYGYVARVGRR
jgi:hypothetical protein